MIYPLIHHNSNHRYGLGMVVTQVDMDNPTILQSNHAFHCCVIADANGDLDAQWRDMRAMVLIAICEVATFRFVCGGSMLEIADRYHWPLECTGEELFQDNLSIYALKAITDIHIEWARLLRAVPQFSLYQELMIIENFAKTVVPKYRKEAEKEGRDFITGLKLGV